MIGTLYHESGYVQHYDSHLGYNFIRHWRCTNAGCADERTVWHTRAKWCPSCRPAFEKVKSEERKAAKRRRTA